MKCPDPQCGVDNAETARFCRSCGAVLVHDRAGEPSAKQCPACGRSVPEQARFCGKCGCPIPSGPTENVEALIEPRRAPDPEPVPSITADERGAAAEVSSAPETIAAVPVNALDDTGTIAKPVFLVSVIAAIVVVGSIAFWVYFGQAAPSAADTNAAGSTPSTPLPPAVSAPEAAQPPIMPPNTATEVTTGKPFDTLLTPTEEPQIEATPTSEEEARAKAERARKRHRARLARRAAEKKAREAALRNAQPPEPPPPSSVKELCAGETSLFNRNSCEARNCQTKEWMFTSYCMQRRKLEDEKRRGVFGTGN